MAPTLCRRGADLATVRDTLGHASIATTSRYLHARPEKSSGGYLAL
jgi:site-specific recombinase XerD